MHIAPSRAHHHHRLTVRLIARRRPAMQLQNEHCQLADAPRPSCCLLRRRPAQGHHGLSCPGEAKRLTKFAHEEEQAEEWRCLVGVWRACGRAFPCLVCGHSFLSLPSCACIRASLRVTAAACEAAADRPPAAAEKRRGEEHARHTSASETNRGHTYGGRQEREEECVRGAHPTAVHCVHLLPASRDCGLTSYD